MPLARPVTCAQLSKIRRFLDSRVRGKCDTFLQFPTPEGVFISRFLHPQVHISYQLPIRHFSLLQPLSTCSWADKHCRFLAAHRFLAPCLPPPRGPHFVCCKQCLHLHVLQRLRGNEKPSLFRISLDLQVQIFPDFSTCRSMFRTCSKPVIFRTRLSMRFTPPAGRHFRAFPSPPDKADRFLTGPFEVPIGSRSFPKKTSCCPKKAHAPTH